MQRRESFVARLSSDPGPRNRGSNKANNPALFDYLCGLAEQGVIDMEERDCVLYAFNGETTLPYLPTPMVDPVTGQ